jgi:predicted outer membrane repeat protein
VKIEESCHFSLGWCILYTRIHCGNVQLSFYELYSGIDGGIALQSATFIMKNCSNSNNMAMVIGGIIDARESTITMHQCSFNNHANLGGAIHAFCTNFTLSGSDPTVPFTFRNPTESIVVTNNMANTKGGFFDPKASNIIIRNCNFHNNSAQFGDAFAIQRINSTFMGGNRINMPINFTNNTATDLGGVIFADNSIITAMQRSFLFHSNEATQVCECFVAL